MTETKVIIDCETGEESIVPLTADELAERDERAAAEAALAKQADAAAETQAAALAVVTAKLDPAAPDPSTADLLTALATIVGDAG